MRVTKVGKNSQNSIILIPGGPGLSTSYLRSMDQLSDKYQLHYLDLCGTNGTEVEILDAIKIASKIKEYAETIESGFTLLGHSYGGYLASKTATITSPRALICISTPLSSNSMNFAIDNYSQNRSRELIEKEAQWLANNSDDTFKAWLSSYGKLYFNTNDERWKDLFLKDNTSYRFFLNNSNDIENDKSVLIHIARTDFPKLFIAGNDDALIPPSVLKIDAEAGSFKYSPIDNAGHFPMLENPKRTISTIDDFISTIPPQRK